MIGSDAATSRQRVSYPPGRGPTATTARRALNEATVARIRALLDDVAFDTAWDAGLELSFEELPPICRAAGDVP